MSFRVHGQKPKLCLNELRCPHDEQESKDDVKEWQRRCGLVGQPKYQPKKNFSIIQWSTYNSDNTSQF